jgi:hypothetical protein
MNDYSKPYRGVAYFGLWATETADDYGRRDAAAILAAAAEVCSDEDVREDREVRAALAYLVQQGHDKRARQFRQALDIQHPHQRRQAAADAVNAIHDALGLSWGKTPARF